jgi:hypothetical protein
MGTITYQTGTRAISHIYRATSGGTVFSANLNASTVFDYFTDTAVVNDALYFGIALNGNAGNSLSKILFNIGTALAGTGITIVWEFYQRDLTPAYYGGSGTAAGWYALPSFADDTNGFTTTGSQAFKFGLPYGWTTVAVNGVTENWIRARISALTTITEGGANQTTIATGYNAEVNINGYTDGSPCTFTDVMTYLNTNAPWLACKKTNYYFDFREVCLDINSRLLSLRETVEIGFFGLGSANGYYDLSYLQMGEKVGDYFGKNGGCLIVDMSTNSFAGIITTTTRFYGTTILTSIGGSGAGGFGYPSWGAETLGYSLLNMNPSPSNYGIIANCLINHGSTWIAAGWFGYFNDNKVIIPNEGTGFQALGLFYNNGITVRNLDYQFTTTTSPSSGYIIYFYNSSANSNVEWNFINTKTPLPARGSTSTCPRMFYRSTASIGNWGQAWKYDDSAGTYTDITTAVNDATLNDIDISGDVGDIIYLGMSASFLGRWHEIVSTNGANDYEYAFEYYSGATGGWQEFEYVWDSSNNFAQSGRMYFSRAKIFFDLATSTINGYAGFWHRIRITKKGTGTPKISRMRGGSEAGIGRWNAYEKYSIDTKIVDKDNVAIEDAVVTLSQGGSLITTGTTDANGQAIFTGDELVNTFLNSTSNPYETFVCSGRDITSAINTTGFGYCGAPKIINFVVGKTYRLSYNLTLNSGTAPTINIEANANGSGVILQALVATASAGQQSLDFVSTVNGSWFLDIRVGNGVATNFSMTDISLKEIDQSYPCTYRHWYLDPINVTTTNFNIAEDTTSDWDISVSKVGYETYTNKITMSKKQDLTIELKKAIDIMVTNKGIGIRADPTNSTKDRDFVILP